MKQAAGTLLYRTHNDVFEVLLVHPSGPYNRRSPWGIPKGMPLDGEPLDLCARRETLEETGVDVQGPLVPLGHIDYRRSRKRVHAFGAPLPEGQTPRCAQWEVDGVEMMNLDDARKKIHPDQATFIDRLLEHLGKTDAQ